ncbi:hypothetical protein [Streptomyces sp. NPDC006879]|uniref:hypothetical protein n=1 Tax=Streptomyces sp. NPDC006879 TaxID=3364767 RepID=UPI0036C53A91
MSTEQTHAQHAAPNSPVPARLIAAAALTALEGLALAGLGVYLLVMGLLGDPDSPQQAETGGVTLLALALLPLAAAHGLRLRRRWARGPALITQLMAVPVSWTLIDTGGGVLAGGIALAAAALTALVLLVSPTTTQALGAGPRGA